jgi:NADPH:quinone reductase-like Zn-dependent oxidoreductase
MCAVADADVVPIRANVPDAVVASLGLSAVAAWMSLTWRGRLQAGEGVLVLGAGGAVGQVAVGAARVIGASRVVAVARSAASQDRARRAGADEVVPSTEDVDELTARLREACGGSVDLVVDPVFGTAATAAARVLAPFGRLVNLGGASGDEAAFSSSVLRGRSVEILGYTNNALSAEQRAQALTAVLQHAERGVLAVDHRVLPLEEAEQAWTATAGGAGHRLVLIP